MCATEYQLKYNTGQIIQTFRGDKILKALEKWWSIEKISWFEGDTHYRYRPKTNGNVCRWCTLSEQKIASLCPAYRDADEHQIFWINQATIVSMKAIDDFVKANGRRMTDDEESAACILEVLTDKQFKSLF